MVLASVVEANEEEEGPKRSRYVSVKDIRLVALVLVPLVALLTWVFFIRRGAADETYCRQNLHQIGLAMLTYSAEFDDCLPPTHYMNPDGTPASAQGSSLPIVWVTAIQGHMSPRQDFWCRSTGQIEGWKGQAGVSGKKEVSGSYGMYRGLSSTPRDKVTSPDDTILVAETTNNGANQSFDPSPFGPGIDDGFLIGWDDDNLEFSKQSQWATRLAFSDAATGYQSASPKGRHGKAINAITVVGNLKRLVPSDAKIEHAAPRLKGLWWTDPNYYR